MRKNVLTIMVLLISGTMLAQNGGTFMKKYENQLPQSGYRIRFAQSRHQIDAGKSKHIYRTAIENLCMGRQERQCMGYLPINETDGSQLWAGK